MTDDDGVMDNTEARKCDRDCCGHEVVRPGKTQCWCDSLGGPWYNTRDGDARNDHIAWVGYMLSLLHKVETQNEELRDENDRLLALLQQVFDLAARADEAGAYGVCESDPCPVCTTLEEAQIALNRDLGKP